MLSEDRHAEGIAPGLSVADNLTLSRMSAFGPFGLVIPRRQAAAAGKWVRYLGIDCDDVTRSVLDLTCSDMQKVALARLLHHDADILLLDEPTAGMTVTGRADIYRVIDRLACGDREEGLSPRAIIMVSSDLSELMGMCDRIAVMARGVLHPAKPVAEWTEQRLRMAVMGQVAA
jgi:ribose transport system ATP-binding protein